MMRFESLFRRGYRAWLAGDLEEAERCYQSALRERPGSPDALCHYARALSELGRKDKALELLDEAERWSAPRSSTGATEGGREPGGASAGEARGADPPASRPSAVSRLYRAVVLHDHGDLVEARPIFESLRQENLLARAFLGLLDLREKLVGGGVAVPSTRVKLPLAARWLADVAGRALALLEQVYFASRPADAIEFHWSLFVPESTPPPARQETGPTAQTAATDRSQPPVSGQGGMLSAPAEASQASTRSHASADPCKEPDLMTRVEEAFLGAHYEEVTKICGEGADTAGATEPLVGFYRAFSLMALGKHASALRLVERILAESRGDWDVHFLAGLCHSRSGAVRPAAWSFARAARLKDTYVDEILCRLPPRLGVALEFEDAGD